MLRILKLKGSVFKRHTPTSSSPLPCFKDKPQQVQQDLCGEDACAARLVIVGGDFDEVYADDLVGLGDVLEELQHFVIEETAVAWRACARRDGGAEGIDIKGDVDAGS